MDSYFLTPGESCCRLCLSYARLMHTRTAAGSVSPRRSPSADLSSGAAGFSFAVSSASMGAGEPSPLDDVSHDASSAPPAPQRSPRKAGDTSIHVYAPVGGSAQNQSTASQANQSIASRASRASPNAVLASRNPRSRSPLRNGMDASKSGGNTSVRDTSSEAGGFRRESEFSKGLKLPLIPTSSKPLLLHVADEVVKGEAWPARGQLTRQIQALDY